MATAKTKTTADGLTETMLPEVGDSAAFVAPTVAPEVVPAVPFDAENPLPYFQSFDPKTKAVEAVGNGTYRAIY